MNKYDFIKELRGRLKRLPSEEIEEAIRYYQEYFDEAGIGDEPINLKAIGTPAAAASEILAQTAIRQVENYPSSAKKSISSIVLILLAIFGAPIALPLAIALAVTVCALVFAVGVVFFSLFITFIALGICGIVMLAAAFTQLTTDPPAGIVVLGTALILIALCILFTIAVCYVTSKVIPIMMKIVNKIIVDSKKGQRI